VRKTLKPKRGVRALPLSSLMALAAVSAMASQSCGGGGVVLQTCLEGASESDCQLCGATLPSECSQVCPAVDCSTYPPPAACAPLCAGAACCTCERVAGDIYDWQTPQVAPQCGTNCTDMLARWNSYLTAPAMSACHQASDCIVVGGQPSLDPCNGHSAIGYCGVAANAAAYQASPAAGLETAFAATCRDHVAFDCGPGYATCTSGKCVIEGWACCMCQPDGGG